MEWKKDQKIRVEITDIGAEGEGIGKQDGFPFFIKDAVIGDVVEARIMKSKKNYAYAKLEKVVIPSPFRVQPLCRYHRQCGGCQIQAMDYARQLKFKQEKVRNHLFRGRNGQNYGAHCRNGGAVSLSKQGPLSGGER